MDYHQDRFEDGSMLVFKNETLVAVFPANKLDTQLYSHQGLTYGGLVLSKKVTLNDAMNALQSLLGYCKNEGYEKLTLKLLPTIYHQLPSDEMTYFLFLLDAKLVRRDVSSSIHNTNVIKIKSNRLEGKKKAQKQGLIIKEDSNFKLFWNTILIPNLEEKHQTKPVHSLNEIEYLHSKFPENIKQFNVYKDNEIVAGATIFETHQVAHVQYISANSHKQEFGSLDFLFENLINDVFNNKVYFDFGISNINQGKNINNGLLFWKEGFGARPIVHDFYDIDLKNINSLKDVFI